MRFHATAPPRQWLNDPNALLREGDGWTLHAQHRADAPDFRATGWGRLTSPDLLRWRWAGPSIPAAPGDWAYSGCVARDGGVAHAVHTRHADGLESQVVRAVHGGVPGPAREALGPARRNWRDPWVMRDGGGWLMWLAAPCPWSDWGDARSMVECWRAGALAGPWRPAFVFDPGLPPGVLAEVPVALPRADGRLDLLLSTLDRRQGRADGAVLRFTGALTAEGFAAGPPRRLDLGPDWYAATASPDAPELVVAWASSWTTARLMDWDGAHGGPISVPRRLTPEGLGLDRAVVSAFTRPTDAPADGRATVRPAGDWRVDAAGPEVRLEIALADGMLTVRREGPAAFRHDLAQRIGRAARRLTLFADGPLLELHIAPDDLWVTANVPGRRAVGFVGGDLGWTTLEP